DVKPGPVVATSHHYRVGALAVSSAQITAGATLAGALTIVRGSTKRARMQYGAMVCGHCGAGDQDKRHREVGQQRAAPDQRGAIPHTGASAIPRVQVGHFTGWRSPHGRGHASTGQMDQSETRVPSTYAGSGVHPVPVMSSDSVGRGREAG